MNSLNFAHAVTALSSIFEINAIGTLSRYQLWIHKKRLQNGSLGYMLWILLVTPCLLSGIGEFIYSSTAISRMAVLSDDKFPYPWKQTRGNECIPFSNFNSYKVSEWLCETHWHHVYTEIRSNGSLLLCQWWRHFSTWSIIRPWKYRWQRNTMVPLGHNGASFASRDPQSRWLLWRHQWRKLELYR